MAVTREIPQPHHELDITDDYRRLVEGALPDMGYNPEADGVPALEQVQANIAAVDGLSTWLLERAAQGAKDTLVISRTVGGRYGIGVAQTIHSLDPSTHAAGYAWSVLWGNAQGDTNPFGDNNVVHNPGKTDPNVRWETAILLGDQTDPASGKTAYDPGLAYTSKTVPAQREAFAKEAAALKIRGITLAVAKLGAMVTDYSAIRNEGGPQRAGVTRFIDYPEQKIGAESVACVPGVLDDEQLNFRDSVVGNGWRGNGARRLVRVPEQPLES